MEKPGAPRNLRLDWYAAPKGIFLPPNARPNSSKRPNFKTVCDLTKTEKRNGFEKIKIGNLKGVYYVESMKLSKIPDLRYYINQKRPLSDPIVLSLIHLT